MNNIWSDSEPSKTTKPLSKKEEEYSSSLCALINQAYINKVSLRNYLEMKIRETKERLNTLKRVYKKEFKHGS